MRINSYVFINFDVPILLYVCIYIFCCLIDPGRILSVGEWLEENGLGHYENTLVANGFDHTDFLVSSQSFKCGIC